MKIDEFPKTFHVPCADPRRDMKRKAMEALLMAETAPSDVADLADFSGVESLAGSAIEAEASLSKRVLIAPWHQAEALKLPESVRSRLFVAWPFRCWGAAEKARSFRIAGSAGELVSFRIFLNWPKGRASSVADFKTRLIPQLLDLCEYVGGAAVETLQLNCAPGSNNVFALAKLSGNIVAELDVNEALPDTLDPLRFVHAYFTEGALTNLPLAGFTNFEGSLYATASGVERPVYESMSWPGADELDNLYFRMLWTQRGGLSQAGVSSRFETLRRLADEAFATGEPARIVEETQP